MKLGVLASGLTDDPRLAPKLARTMGFDGLQFDAYSSSLNLPELSGSGRREFLRLLSAQDRQLVGLRYDLGPKGFGPGSDIDRLLHHLDKVLESAASMMSPLVCLELGPLPAPARQSKPRPKISAEQAGLILIPSLDSAPDSAPESPDPPPDPAFVSQVDSALAELGEKADRYSVIVALRTDLASYAALERATLAAGCPWFGIDLDPAAMVRDEWDMEEVFSRLGPLVRHVRGRDAVAGANGRARPAIIGSGSTDWGTLLANLDASGYRGWLTVDPNEMTDRIGAAEAGRKRLNAIAK